MKKLVLVFVVVCVVAAFVCLVGEKVERRRGPSSIEEEAARLRKRHDTVHIFAVSNCYEVWNTGVLSRRLASAPTLEEARRAVDDYYAEWARNCLGPTPQGKMVE